MKCCVCASPYRRRRKLYTFTQTFYYTPFYMSKPPLLERVEKEVQKRMEEKKVGPDVLRLILAERALDDAQSKLIHTLLLYKHPASHGDSMRLPTRQNVQDALHEYFEAHQTLSTVKLLIGFWTCQLHGDQPSASSYNVSSEDDECD